MTDDWIRCDNHVGEVFPPRCINCDLERQRAKDGEPNDNPEN